jgi:hypothetical protein
LFRRPLILGEEKVDFKFNLKTTPNSFIDWFRVNFGHISDKFKEIAYQDKNGNKAKLIPLNPKISQLNSESAIITYGIKNLTLNTETNEFENPNYDLFVLRITIISLGNERIQVNCTSTSPTSTLLNPLIEDIFQAITFTWKDFEQINTGDEQSARSNNPLDAWKYIPDHGFDKKIIELFCAGKTNKEIGKILNLVPESVTNRISELRQKYKVPYSEEIRRAMSKKIRDVG